MRVAVCMMMLAVALSGCATGGGPTSATTGDAVEGAGSGAELNTGMSGAVRSLLEQGRDQRRAGDYAQASASLERALRVDAGEPQVWLEMGWLRFDEGNYAQAEQMGRKALSLARSGSSVAEQASRLIADAQFGQGR